MRQTCEHICGVYDSVPQPASKIWGGSTRTHNNPEIPCWAARCCFTRFPSSFQYQLSAVVRLASCCPIITTHSFLVPHLCPLPPPTWMPLFLLTPYPDPTHPSKPTSGPMFPMILPGSPPLGLASHLCSQLHNGLLQCAKQLLSCALVLTLVCSHVSGLCSL